MKYFISLAALAVTCAGMAQGSSEAILGYTNSVSGYANATVGWTFQTTNAITVTELGCFAKIFGDNPAITSIQVGLWDQSGSLLASTSIAPGTPRFDQSRYASVPPVALAPGQTYHLGVYSPAGGFGLDVVGPSLGGSVSAAPAVRVVAAASATSGFAYPPELPGTAGLIYAGPNFLFQSQPPLSIQLWPSNQVRLSWSTAFSGYTLQSKVGLFGTWAGAGLPVTVVSNAFVSFNTLGPGPKYYRLIK